MNDCFLKEKCEDLICEKDQHAFCMKKYKTTKLLNLSLIPKIHWVSTKMKLAQSKKDLEAYQQLAAIRADIKSFVKEGNNLYLYSSICGNGKTSWAYNLALAYIDAIWKNASLKCHVLFISVPRLLLELKDNISARSQYVSFIKENVANADLVIWDDIAAKTGTDFEINYLFNFIETRLNSGKANIYTSNLNPTEVGDALDARLRSRICFQKTTQIELKEGDKRAVTSSIRNGGMLNGR